MLVISKVNSRQWDNFFQLLKSYPVCCKFSLNKSVFEVATIYIHVYNKCNSYRFKRSDYLHLLVLKLTGKMEIITAIVIGIRIKMSTYFSFMSAVIVIFSATISVLVTLYLQKLKRRENNKIVKQSFIKQVN